MRAAASLASIFCKRIRVSTWETSLRSWRSCAAETFPEACRVSKVLRIRCNQTRSASASSRVRFSKADCRRRSMRSRLSIWNRASAVSRAVLDSASATARAAASLPNTGSVWVTPRAISPSSEASGPREVNPTPPARRVGSAQRRVPSAWAWAAPARISSACRPGCRSRTDPANRWTAAGVTTSAR